jgi:hypothetical protein
MAKKAKKATTKRWSKKVIETSDAMTLDDGVFKKTPRAIALSVRRSAERSAKRKSTPFRSAMSMLTFYENRAGKKLSATRKSKIEKAKDGPFCGKADSAARVRLQSKLSTTAAAVEEQGAPTQEMVSLRGGYCLAVPYGSLDANIANRRRANMVCNVGRSARGGY